MQELSKRLSAIKALVPDGARACDIGTDHGYLAIELMASGKAKRVIAADINPLPLKNAERNIAKSGVRGIELRLSDGLKEIKSGEVDTVIIAGIGGEVISGIIERGENILKSRETKLILQPTTSPEALREFLYLNGYEIVEEIPLFEKGKLYSVMGVQYCDTVTAAEPFQKYIGLITPQSEEGLMYIKKQYIRCKKCCEALEKIPQKREEYLHYRSVCEGIEKIIKI